MATLEKIRNKSGLMVTAIAIALFCFVIGDALNNSQAFRNGSRNTIGQIEGNDVSGQEFQNQVSVVTSILKWMGRQVSDGEVRDQAWETLVQTYVINSEAEKLGLSVTPQELKDMTLGDSIHPMVRSIALFQNEQHQFDKNILISVLATMDQEGKEDLKKYWMFWEKKIQETLLSEKITSLASNAMSAPKAEQDFLTKLYGKEYKVALSSKPYRELADSLFTPSKDELSKKYADMKESFKTDGYRMAKCIVFDVRPSQQDYQQTEEKVKAAEDYLRTIAAEEVPYFVSQESDAEVPYIASYQTENDVDAAFKSFAFSAKKDSVATTIIDGNSFKTAKVLSDVVNRPDSVKISVIAIVGASLDEANRKADSLITVLNAGADFASVASQNSADPQTRQNGGDMGWIREGQFGLDDFDNTVFTANAGSVNKIELPQNVLIVKVAEKTNPVKKVKLAVISNKVMAGNDTYRSVFEKANSFIVKNNTKEAFDAAAAEENLLVRDLGPMGENQSELYVIENGRPIVKWAYGAKEGEVCKKPFDSKDKYVVAYLSEVVEEGYVPQTANVVSSQLSSSVIKDKKAEKIISEYNPSSDVASFGQVDTVTISFDSNVIPGAGAEPNVIGAVARAEANKVVAPLKGENGVYALKVLEATDDANTERKIQQYGSGINQYISRMLMGTMLKDASVKDNRSVMY